MEHEERLKAALADWKVEIEIEFPGYTYVWHKKHYHDRQLIQF